MAAHDGLRPREMDSPYHWYILARVWQTINSPDSFSSFLDVVYPRKTLGAKDPSIER